MMLSEMEQWREAFEQFHARFADLFERSESREQAKKYLRGLLANVGRKNSWQLAEAVGDGIPDRMQRLLYRVPWDAEAARDRLQQFVIETFGDEEGIGVVDETSPRDAQRGRRNRYDMSDDREREPSDGSATGILQSMHRVNSLLVAPCTRQSCSTPNASPESVDHWCQLVAYGVGCYSGPRVHALPSDKASSIASSCVSATPVVQCSLKEGSPSAA